MSVDYRFLFRGFCDALSWNSGCEVRFLGIIAAFSVSSTHMVRAVLLKNLIRFFLCFRLLFEVEFVFLLVTASFAVGYGFVMR